MRNKMMKASPTESIVHNIKNEDGTISASEIGVSPTGRYHVAFSLPRSTFSQTNDEIDRAFGGGMGLTGMYRMVGLSGITSNKVRSLESCKKTPCFDMKDVDPYGLADMCDDDDDDIAF